jgi:hypothetical protein
MVITILASKLIRTTLDRNLVLCSTSTEGSELEKFQVRNCDGGRVHSSFGSCERGYLDQKVCF